MTDPEQKNIRYHSIEKGCKIIDIRMATSDNRDMKGCLCEVHQKKCCRCGWEWGWHGGTNNKAIKNNELQKALDDKIRIRRKNEEKLHKYYEKN